MPRRAGRKLLHVIFLHQPLTQCRLILWGLVIRIEYLGARTQIILRSVVAIQAPAHIERLGAPGDIHLRDRAVAGGAADALGNVNAVIEIDELRPDSAS